MKFDCPACGQNLDIAQAQPGRQLVCPLCREGITVPPPMHVPLQPLAPGRTVLKKSRRRSGCGTFIFLLLFIAAGAFGYAMYRWQVSPDVAVQRIVAVARTWLRNFAPNTAAQPEAAPSPGQTPRPEPMKWLIAHKERWPAEVILRQPVQFPAVSKGQVVGSLVVPAGAVVNVKEITAADIDANYMGGEARVPIGATDVEDRAKAALAKADTQQSLTSATPSATPSTATAPDQFREATAEEVRAGLGAFYTRAATTFRLFAPTARTVDVVFYNQLTGNDGRTVRPLNQQPGNLWEGIVSGDLAGMFYTFVLDANDLKRAREVVDPYATNTVASTTRARITPLRLNVDAGPKLASPVDAIVYEMHVRDFTIAASSGVRRAGLYPGWTETGTHLPNEDQVATGLDHLRELGVTHVELMPVQDFDNDESARTYNWGYITRAFFSPEGMFASDPNDDSRVRELHALISALHARGIGVIMDVVYNHTAPNCSLMAIAPEYYYRRAPNGSLANGSGCGNEFKSEAPMGRRFILDSLKFWAQEYGIDGFRFDLMALIDRETMRQAEHELHAINPNIILFGEPWTGGTSPLRDKIDKTAFHQVTVGAFNDDFRNALKGSPDGSDPGWIQSGANRDALKAAMLVSSWLNSPAQSINYMTCHDNLVLWDKLAGSMPGTSNALRIETMKLGYLALLTSQGVPFIHGGEEFARTKGGNNNSFEAPDIVNEVDWNLKAEHLDLDNYVRSVIALRKAHPVFRLRDRAQIASRLQFLNSPDRTTLVFTLNGDGLPNETWRRVLVAMNSADNADAQIPLPGGEWIIALDEHGAIDPQPVRGKVNVRYKSGVVLYQR